MEARHARNAIGHRQHYVARPARNNPLLATLPNGPIYVECLLPERHWMPPGIGEIPLSQSVNLPCVEALCIRMGETCRTPAGEGYRMSDFVEAGRRGQL